MTDEFLALKHLDMTIVIQLDKDKAMFQMSF